MSIQQILGSMIQTGTISASKIVSGRISASKITSGTIDNSKGYENDILSFGAFSAWNGSIKNCVIHSVPSWSSMAGMVGKTDSFGNLFTA